MERKDHNMNKVVFDDNDFDVLCSVRETECIIFNTEKKILNVWLVKIKAKTCLRFLIK